MITKVTKKGTSFKGAALYYLHDKKSLTNDRVEFTRTQNLATDNPEMAWKMMAFTAMRHNEIKKGAGRSSTGNKLRKSVYTYILSWQPSEELSQEPAHAPTNEEMIKAGLDTLKILRLHEHESMIVGHNDTEHPHLHVIVNRVHPETGIVNTHSKDYTKLSDWAENYELEQGKILCHKRVENNERRRNGEYVKYREDKNKAEYHRWQREKTNQDFEKRQEDGKNLSQIHKKQRDKLFSTKENIAEDHRKELKERSRPFWASMYSQQKQERFELQEAKSSAISRLAYYVKNRNQERQHGTLDAKRSLLSGAYNAVINFKELENDLMKQQELKRKTFAEEMAQQSRIALKQSNNKHIRDLENLKAIQAKEESLMKARHSQESQKGAMDIASGKAKEEFDRIKRTQVLRNEYNKKSQGQPSDLKRDFNKRYMDATHEREKTTDLKKEFNKEQVKAPDIQKDFSDTKFVKKQQEKERPDNLKKGPEIKKEEKRAFRYINDNRRIEKNENQEKDSDIKKDFNKPRYLPDRPKKETGRGRFTNRDTGKDTGRELS